MIVSISRRTDIPGLYPLWLLNRLRAGFVLVRHPYQSRRVWRVALDPQLVDCLVLWTKNPCAFLPYARTIEEMGYPFYVHCTLTGYGRGLEPNLPELGQRRAALSRLADQLGPKRVIWRFDPIILTRAWTEAHCQTLFSGLARELRGAVRRCTISFLTMYRCNRQALARFSLLDLDDAAKKRLVVRLAAIAAENEIELGLCCDPALARDCGVGSTGCVDGALIAELLGQPLGGAVRDRGQRIGCACAASIDIGAYTTCTHGCLYCYATRSHQEARRNWARHDPNSPLLIGQLSDQDQVRERRNQGGRSPQLPLFPLR